MVLAVLATGARAGLSEDSPDRVEPTFAALLVDGSTARGRVVAIEDASVTLAAKDGKRQSLALDRLVKLTRETAAPVSEADGEQAVYLADGDRLLHATIGTSSDTRLQVRSNSLGDLELPLSSLTGLVLAAGDGASSAGTLANRILYEKRMSEVVWLANGDRLVGSFLGMDDRVIRLQVADRPIEVERGGALAIGFDPALLRVNRPKGGYLEATLNDGTRLGLTNMKLADGNVEATTRFGPAVRFPLGAVARFRARTHSVVYLSERPHAAAQYDSYVGPTRPYRIDENVEGQPIRLGGQVYDRGIGTASRTLIAYRLEPGDRRFQATIGVDERAGPLGSVVFRVLVDRDERFKAPAMTDRDPPRSIDVDLSGGKILILITEFGDRGNIRDLADWAEARIIR
ncbi:MAG: NPCBM/NEW2 domain-containing protein [Isosphaeraceae bacterium]